MISCKKKDVNMYKLKFELSDTGIGMNKKQMGSLFKLFGSSSISSQECIPVQTRATIESSPNSFSSISMVQNSQMKCTERLAGLGLTISQRLCNELRGVIKVHSNPNYGSKFWFSLILSKPEAEFQMKIRSFDRFDSDKILPLHQFKQNITKSSEHITIPNEFLHDPLLKIAEVEEFENKVVCGKGDLGSIENSPTQSFDDTIPDELILKHELRVREKYMPYSQINYSKISSFLMSSCRCPKFLIVDDHVINRVVLSRFLSTLGLASLQASNGEECIQIVTKQAREKKACCGGFRIIFMDLQMPVKGGIEATQELKKLVRAKVLSNMMIVAVTAYASQKEREKCVRVGMDGFISKPVTEAALKKCLNEFFTLM